ncbi:hypothetical protein N4G69_55435, partial [Streptomyces mirabilis]|nr:hypothetical protein [Streptomyces mirabilis]
KVVASGRHLVLMAHFTHPQELGPPVVRDAMRRVRRTGAVIRCQEQDGRVREHTRLDYEWFSAQVYGSTSNVKVLDTFSNVFGPQF